MIKISLVESGGRIAEIKIFGDFYLYPEEGIEALEVGLKGTDLSKKEIIAKCTEIVAAYKIEMFGITPESLADAILLACRDACQ